MKQFTLLSTYLKTLAFGLLFFGQLTGAIAGEKMHTVKKGESIAKIANFYGVAQRDLRNANGIGKGAIIDIGDQLVIPEVLRGGASKSHVIKKGDTLLKVAKKYKVTIADLADTNKMGPKESLTVGRTLVIPGDENEDYALSAPKETPISIVGGKAVAGGVQHTVQAGQSLWLIARAYNTSGDRIAKRNGISKADPLSVGRTLFIPGATADAISRERGRGPKTARFVRVHTGKRLTLRLLNRNGQVNAQSRLALSKLARDRKGKKRYRMLHPRLIQLLQRVSDQFPGQTIEIVSGYRAAQKGHRLSKHNVGQAVDFRVADVPNRELYEYIKTLPKAGTGYYPNSVFVHLDVRDKSYTWTDISSSGEKAHYVKPGENNAVEDSEAEPIEAEADSRADDDRNALIEATTQPAE